MEFSVFTLCALPPSSLLFDFFDRPDVYHSERFWFFFPVQAAGKDIKMDSEFVSPSFPSVLFDCAYVFSLSFFLSMCFVAPSIMTHFHRVSSLFLCIRHVADRVNTHPS